MVMVSAAEWDAFIQHHPEAHLLQTGLWGDLKQDFGWQPVRLLAGDCGAQILFRPLPLGLAFAYLPKGPLGDVAGWQSLWKAVDRVCRSRRVVLLKVEPDFNEPLSPIQRQLFDPFVPSDPVQPRRTILVSLAGSEDQWMEHMKPKTRYNIRLAERKGVEVHPSGDLDVFYNLVEVTSQRDGFGVHQRAYYQKAYELFYPRGQCELLIARFEGRPLAGLMVFAQGRRAWYLYGASNDEERSRMPAYLLQWEAMRWAARQGCQEYDLVGVPDEEEAALEAGFTSRSEGLWGVYRFKRGFGGELVRSAGAYDRGYLPFATRLYQWWRRRRGGAE